MMVESANWPVISETNSRSIVLCRNVLILPCSSISILHILKLNAQDAVRVHLQMNKVQQNNQEESGAVNQESSRAISST
jgi:hypothetical protein